ncbi:MAG: hypothetical protein IKV86_05415 [Clostridia bacterium]|nr:hypothetical protein [Clostridia bacterium]
MIIKVMAKKATKNSNGNYGTRLCYAYHDETFEGFPVTSIWVPAKYAKPESIIIGGIYEMTTFLKFAVRLTPVKM